MMYPLSPYVHRTISTMSAYRLGTSHPKKADDDDDDDDDDDERNGSSDADADADPDDEEKVHLLSKIVVMDVSILRRLWR